jgi:uncharacterized membrane protein YqjE
MKNLRWLFPALTAGILINLSLNDTSVLDGLGITFGLLYLWAAIMGAWELYGRGKP